MTLPIDHGQEMQAIQDEIVKYLEARFQGKDQEMVLTVMVSLTVRLALAISPAPDPKASLIRAVSQVADLMRGEPDTTIRH